MTGLRPLTAGRAAEAWAFCERAPLESIHIAGWLGDGGLEAAGPPPHGRGWLFGEDDPRGGFRGLALITSVGILYPAGRSLGMIDGLTALARANPGTLRVIVGQRFEVDALWQRLGGIGLGARAVRSQTLMALDRASFRRDANTAPLRPATESDAEQIIEASARMALEESKEDPQRRNPRLFGERITARIRRGRDFVQTTDDGLVFKCNVSALSSLAGQIEGIYTSPAFRRRGIGRAGTAWITEWVLARSERVALLVNDDNTEAQTLYRGLGYRDVHPSRTVFIAP